MEREGESYTEKGRESGKERERETERETEREGGGNFSSECKRNQLSFF